MAAVAATTEQHSSGDLTLYTYTFATNQITDGQTFDTGVGDRVVIYHYQVTGDPTNNTGGACAVDNSAGVITFYPAVDNIAGSLFVYATGV